MEKRLIGRGTLCGIIAGLVAFVFARIFAEPQIQAGIDYESARDEAQAALDAAAGLPVGAEMGEIFTRGIQENLGIGVGIVAFGAAMGAFYAVAYVAYVGRVGNIRPRTLALLVAGGGFLGMYLVPFIKYPANPPAIGHSETIQARGALYLAMVVCSVAFLVGAVWFGQRLRPRFGAWNATLLAAAAFIVAIGIVMLVLPAIGHLDYNRQAYGDVWTETPVALTGPDGVIAIDGFPADVLYSFRFYSVAAQLILWAVIGLLFAPMAERLLSTRQAGGAAELPVVTVEG